MFSFGLADIFQWPLSVVSTNDVMVAWSSLQQTLRHVHLTWPVGEQCLHFYSLKWFLFCVDAGVVQNWYIFDTVILQMCRIFQLLILDVETMILSFVSPLLLELNCVILLVRFANEGYLHCLAWLMVITVGGYAPPVRLMRSLPAWLFTRACCWRRDFVQKALEINEMEQLGREPQDAELSADKVSTSLVLEHLNISFA